MVVCAPGARRGWEGKEGRLLMVGTYGLQYFEGRLPARGMEMELGGLGRETLRGGHRNMTDRFAGERRGAGKRG